MANICIIPARGGSKRIPGKNIKDFLGKPIIAYSIETALKSKLFDEVMVSTDDETIASIARDLGAKVPFMRNSTNADDFATTIDVIHEVLGEYKKRQKMFENTCCIYATAPFIQIKHLRKGFDKLILEKLDTVFPVVPFSFPIWRGVSMKKGKISMVWPEYMESRSQDLEPIYHDAGQWYWINNATLSNKLWTDNTGSIILSEHEVQDIDHESDWKIAELKFKLLSGR